MKILFVDFKAKLWKDGIFKAKIWNESLHQDNNDNDNDNGVSQNSELCHIKKCVFLDHAFPAPKHS